jgi:hypothetical protein
MKRVALIVALVAIALSAALGVYALVGGTFGDTEGKLLGTSLLVTAAAIVALAAAVALESGNLGKLPYLGIGAAIAGFGMLVVGVWVEVDADGYLRVAGTLIIVSLMFGHMGLIELARLPRPQQWVVVATHLLAVAATGVIVGAIWFESSSSLYWRAGGVVFVLFAAATVTVPILHRIADIPEPSAEGSVIRCPFCGHQVSGAVGARILCEGCSRAWRVETD